MFSDGEFFSSIPLQVVPSERCRLTWDGIFFLSIEVFLKSLLPERLVKEEDGRKFSNDFPSCEERRIEAKVKGFRGGGVFDLVSLSGCLLLQFQNEFFVEVAFHLLRKKTVLILLSFETLSSCETISDEEGAKTEFVLISGKPAWWFQLWPRKVLSWNWVRYTAFASKEM